MRAQNKKINDAFTPIQGSLSPSLGLKSNTTMKRNFQGTYRDLGQGV